MDLPVAIHDVRKALRRVLVEEERSDYSKVSCMMLPFRIVTKLGGQRLADLNVDSYDLQTAVPSARFTMTVVP